MFIEETSEYVYNVDKMINHLHMAGKFEDCKGIIFGDFDNCRKVRDEDWSVEDIVDEIAKLYKNQQFIIYKWTLPSSWNNSNGCYVLFRRY